MTTLTDISSIKKRAILFDATRCIDCRACMVACSVENNVPNDVTRIWLAGDGVVGQYPDLDRATMPYHCMHCEKPACASACPVGAYTKRPDGPVIYDGDKCIGCRYCMNACPFDVPHFEWDRGVDEHPIIIKCDLCSNRVDSGGEPACVATCPTDALIFGDRDDLLKYAKERIGNYPDRYVHEVYGETENGGTSYLIISHVPFEQLGLPTNIGDEPVSELSEKIMEVTLPFAVGWAAVLSGVTAGVRKYHQKQAAESAEETEKEA
ncbi:MAG: 4Fe-4S dicluster domain-containing protein [Chloroflexi bacterium]|nr:4Fe-4S dicluster domain-containing protein [Chloroflexota bacterium]